MSFTGSAGHKSPFTERTKAAKSHLTPRRSTTSGVANSRGAQQSLFGKESSSAKVCQLRGAQPDVKEPTTPTRGSEGGSKSSRRDDFSSTFARGRVATPIKTPKTAFGTTTTTTPRSPKRPYLGSPKYQKVLLERPAFYNSPSPAEPLTESGKKEVSIAELQQRLKRFLQDENTPNQSLEVPYAISRSPRVNPLFHNDNTLQVSKGGVAFTAGVTETTSLHSPNVVFFKNNEDACSAFALHTTPPSPETAPLPQSLSEEQPPPSTDASIDTDPMSPTMQQPALRAEDFVHSEFVDSSKAEEVCDGFHEPPAFVAPQANNSEELPPCEPSAFVASQVCDNPEELPPHRPSSIVAPQVCDDPEEVPPQLEKHCVANSSSSIIDEEVLECKLSQDATHVLNSSAEKALEEVEKSAADVAVGLHLEAREECRFSEEEEEEEEIEVLKSWPQRFLEFVVIAVVVACVMGAMVLVPKSSSHVKPLAEPFSSSIIPISTGFFGLGREHEGMPCQPGVHLGLGFLSSTFSIDASQNEGPAPSYVYDSFSLSGKYSELVEIDRVADFDELKTVTDHFKQLQGRLLSDVAGLTTESTLSDSLNTGVATDGGQFAVNEFNDPEFMSETASEEQQLEASDESDREQLGDGSSIAQVPESDHQISLDTASDLESDQVSADDVELNNIALDPVTHVPNVEALHVLVPIMSDIISIDTTEPMSSEPASESPITEEELSEEYPIASPPVQGTDIEDLHLDSVVNVGHEEEHITVDYEEPQSQSTTDPVDSVDVQYSAQTLVTEATCKTPPSLEEVLRSSIERFYPEATIGLLVAALACAVVSLLLKARKGATNLTSAAQAEAPTEGLSLIPDTAAALKSMSSPVAWPTTHSVYDSHIPNRDELDAITSPLRKYGMENYGAAEPALSAPGHFQMGPARVEQKPAMTWHPAMQRGGNTISSSYRQTASFVPSQSGISTCGGGSDMDSVGESALTMGAEEWEHLGSYTTSELISVNEGGEEQRRLTPVRRSQRIRNKVSPLPVSFS